MGKMPENEGESGQGLQPHQPNYTKRGGLNHSPYSNAQKARYCNVTRNTT